ncbi:MAG: TIGR00268 family protein [Planctomycetes bacterium RIFCSPHIGHO2_02_FULL_40_12]|nr:MAG: TIGR00268 family protein [Planctomycetes bacterium RIFCSPHIGHO2_02_FULL_40_12]
MTVEEKLSKLKKIVSELKSVVVAFSGGVDSTLVAKVCYDILKDNAMAVTARSETYPDFEFKEAQKLAKEIGIKHLVIDTSELAIEGFADNPPDRCYFCKTELFEKLKVIAKQYDFLNVADGANLDDTQEFRPGLKASKELNVKSPLKESGMTKKDIREVSRMLNLPNWNKPAYACMSSRFPYGQSITEEKLRMVSEAEKYLRNLGLVQFRVRHHETIARIEALPEDIHILANSPTREELLCKFKEIGFTYVTLDLEGYRSGSMNEVLSVSAARNHQ